MERPIPKHGRSADAAVGMRAEPEGQGGWEELGASRPLMLQKDDGKGAGHIDGITPSLNGFAAITCDCRHTEAYIRGGRRDVRCVVESE